MTATYHDEFGKPVGRPVTDWQKRPMPPQTPMAGQHVTVRPIDPLRDAKPLFDANHLAKDGSRFTYLFTPSFDDLGSYQQWLAGMSGSDDPLLHAIVDNETGQAVGIAAFMRIDTTHGVIEVGNINYSPLLARRIGATEAMYLMMKRAFDELGYRRYEWKCDDQNAPSRRAAQRFGFTFEGIFRNHMVYKGRSRDTAWFSITDDEWPRIRAGFETWLSPANFTADGQQKQSLEAIRAALP